MDVARGLEEVRRDAEVTPASVSLTAPLITRESTRSHLKNTSGKGVREDCLSFPGSSLPMAGGESLVLSGGVHNLLVELSLPPGGEPLGERPGLACVLEGLGGLSELFTISKYCGYVSSREVQPSVT